MAMTGSAFARYVSGMDRAGREHAIVDELLKGNIPDFLRKLKPVRFIQRFADGKTTTATIFAMPDYLAIGSDQDYLLIPMNLYSAIEIAVKFGFILPTRKIVDAIFKQSDGHFPPEPMQAGPQMTSTEYYLRHNQTIEEQRLTMGFSLGELVSGHKKDVVLTNRLARTIGKIAIYGWHRLSGVPIQPLSTVHNATYADYSHGIRLVSDTVLIDNKPQSIYDVLKDPKLSSLLSDEGIIGIMGNIRQFLPVNPREQDGPRTILSDLKGSSSP
ncbi:MAG TPA: hypothetical protein DCP92_14205 [Nitrospiraceae bacterium]|jgi:hypothetical protein|nr:hypothetical protein [Nitrospiraceae bacterium]